MDLRFYHDGMGQDTYPEQLEGLNITYEDYEPGFGTPYGIARTSELTLLGAGGDADRRTGSATWPTRCALLRSWSTRSEQLVSAQGLRRAVTPVDRSTPAKATIEDHLDFLFDLLPGPGRAAPLVRVLGLRRHHAHLRRGPARWRYDVGGYAWDNSELSPDLWLWYAFLRSGRADIFRFAEAMTRHTGEVDVYHLGKWAGLGTRHGVQHWADSAKQQRISHGDLPALSTTS